MAPKGETGAGHGSSWEYGGSPSILGHPLGTCRERQRLETPVQGAHMAAGKDLWNPSPRSCPAVSGGQAGTVPQHPPAAPGQRPLHTHPHPRHDPQSFKASVAANSPRGVWETGFLSKPEHMAMSMPWTPGPGDESRALMSEWKTQVPSSQGSPRRA